jgi:hypothetical protein
METDKIKRKAVGGFDIDPAYFIKDMLVFLLFALIVWGMVSSFLESEQIRTGKAETETIYIQRIWAESCGLTGTCYYAATESKSMRLQSAVWLDDTTDRDLFVRAVEGYNCAVITNNTIRRIEPEGCE